MKLIPIDDRVNKHCYFCGTDRSVKYVVKVSDPVLSEKPTNVYYCNRCAAIFSCEMEEEES